MKGLGLGSEEIFVLKKDFVLRIEVLCLYMFTLKKVSYLPHYSSLCVS